MYWDFALILAFLGVAIPWLGQRRVRQLMQATRTTKMDRLGLYASTMAFQWLAAGIVLWRTASHGVPLVKLGFAFANLGLTLVASLVLCALVLANQLFGLRRMVALRLEIKGVLPQLVKKVFPQDESERLAFFALVLSVAVCEEFIYRGFVQRAFEDWLGGSIPAGILISAVFFALAHLYQGRRGMASTFAVGLVFSMVRHWTRSLVPSIGGHFAADFAIGFLAPKYLRKVLVDGATAQGHAISAPDLDP